MSTPSRFRTVSTTTTSTDYELMTDTLISASIRERNGMSAQQYTDALAGNGIFDMNFQIFGSGFTVQVNNEVAEPLIDGEVYTTSDFVRSGTKSIKISTNNAPILFRFNIL